ncbi:DUF1761 domain-containing protein [Lewinella lacunae]|uniref:DUF1761 domain-containing protein n=2 Tax=Neolewinella lacunae TaxID=1517758 RepID=A0A923PLC8_9BACT|nr:DUF1761 domain-containing protein [Neolewinella lacunae]
MPLNFWLVFVVALIPLAIGFLYYGPVMFHRTWMREAGLTEEQLAGASMLKIFGLTYLFSFFITMALQMVVIHQFGLSGLFAMLPEWNDPGSALWADLNALHAKWDMYARHRHFGHGALHGGMFALMFVWPIIAINGLFERKSWKYIAIHTGYWFLCLTLMGGVLCQWLQLPLPPV